MWDETTWKKHFLVHNRLERVRTQRNSKCLIPIQYMKFSLNIEMDIRRTRENTGHEMLCKPWWNLWATGSTVKQIMLPSIPALQVLSCNLLQLLTDYVPLEEFKMEKTRMKHSLFWTQGPLESWVASWIKNYTDPRFTHLPTHRKALRSLTWDVGFLMISSNLLPTCIFDDVMKKMHNLKVENYTVILRGLQSSPFELFERLLPGLEEVRKEPGYIGVL